MKKIVVGLVCILLAAALVVPVVAKSKCDDPVYITNEEKFYKFQKLSKAWTEKEPGEFCDYFFVRRDRSSIFIYSRAYTVPPEEFDLFTALEEWIEDLERRIQGKYKWMRSIKIIEEGEKSIRDEYPAVWSVIKYGSPRGIRKEKIHLLKGGNDKFYYLLRLSCDKRYFGKHLKEFEHLVESFGILEEPQSS